MIAKGKKLRRKKKRCDDERNDICLSNGRPFGTFFKTIRLCRQRCRFTAIITTDARYAYTFFISICVNVVVIKNCFLFGLKKVVTSRWQSSAWNIEFNCCHFKPFFIWHRRRSSSTEKRTIFGIAHHSMTANSEKMPHSMPQRVVFVDRQK